MTIEEYMYVMHCNDRSPGRPSPWMRWDHRPPHKMCRARSSSSAAATTYRETVLARGWDVCQFSKKFRITRRMMK